MTTDATARVETDDVPVRTDTEDASTERGQSAATVDGQSSPEATIAAIGAETAAVKRREVDECLGKLEARGDLAPDERAAVESVADALVARLLAVPAESLRGADEATLDTARELFGREQGGDA